LYPRDVEKIFVPVLEKSKQAEFQNFAEDVRKQRERAKDLLNYATRAVEIAIEDSEDAALQFLQAANVGEAG
jgi:type I restriction enzyme, S subunit